MRLLKRPNRDFREEKKGISPLKVAWSLIRLLSLYHQKDWLSSGLNLPEMGPILNFGGG